MTDSATKDITAALVRLNEARTELREAEANLKTVIGKVWLISVGCRVRDIQTGALYQVVDWRPMPWQKPWIEAVPIGADGGISGKKRLLYDWTLP